MTEHLSTEKIKEYAKREMKPAEILAADEHLSRCDSCFAKIKDFRPPQSFTVFDSLRLSPEEQEHLSYERMENYVDEKSGKVEREIIAVHLERCDYCQTQVSGLMEMREEIAADLRMPPDTQIAEASIFGRIGNAFSGFSLFQLRFAAPVFVLLVSIVGAFWILSRNSTDEIAVKTSRETNSSQSNQNLTINPPVNIQPNDVDSNINAAPQTNVKIEANVNADSINPQIAASNIPPQYEKEVQQVLTTERLNLPPGIKELNSQSGTLMSGGTSAIPFALLNPVGKIVQSNRPLFRWNNLAGAESYVVSVYDENFNKITVSPPVSTASWQIDKPLARGKIYVWQVTAIKNGEEIKSPVRPAPDARFKILEAKSADELSRLSRQYKNDHLFLGIIYAKAGLLEEAEREFRKEIGKNPNSKQARKFLREIRANRQTK